MTRDRVQEPVDRIVGNLCDPGRVRSVDRDNPSVGIHQVTITPALHSRPGNAAHVANVTPCSCVSEGGLELSPTPLSAVRACGAWSSFQQVEPTSDPSVVMRCAHWSTVVCDHSCDHSPPCQLAALRDGSSGHAYATGANTASRHRVVRRRQNAASSTTAAAVSASVRQPPWALCGSVRSVGASEVDTSMTMDPGRAPTRSTRWPKREGGAPCRFW